MVTTLIGVFISAWFAVVALITSAVLSHALTPKVAMPTRTESITLSCSKHCPGSKPYRLAMVSATQVHDTVDMMI